MHMNKIFASITVLSRKIKIAYGASDPIVFYTFISRGLASLVGINRNCLLGTLC